MIVGALMQKVQYINTLAENRPISGARGNNAFYTIFNMPTTIDIRDFSSPVKDEFGEMIWWSKGVSTLIGLKIIIPIKIAAIVS